MDSETPVANTTPSVTQRIDGRLWQVIQGLAREGSTTIEPDSDPRTVMEDLLESTLHLLDDLETARELTPASRICPLCLSPSSIIPLLTAFGPIWIEVGHAGTCPVHLHREERALERRERWRAQYGDIPSDYIPSIVSRASDRKLVDDWLQIATEFEAQVQPRLKPKAERFRVHDLEPTQLDQGILSQEMRRGYERIRKTLQEFATGRKPTQIPGRNGFLDPETGRDILQLVRGLPDPQSITPLQAKAVFHEVLSGTLEWAYYIQDSHFPMNEYAFIALGRRLARFTEEELNQLAAVDWTRTMLVLKNRRPAPS